MGHETRTKSVWETGFIQILGVLLWLKTLFMFNSYGAAIFEKKLSKGVPEDLDDTCFPYTFCPSFMPSINSGVTLQKT